MRLLSMLRPLPLSPYERERRRNHLTPAEMLFGFKENAVNPYLKPFVDRFLGWKLPPNFNPDGGITFKPDFNEGTPYPMKHEPVGTNLLTAIQAEEMLEQVMGDVVSALWHCWTITSPDCTADPATIRQSIQDRCNAVLKPKP